MAAIQAWPFVGCHPIFTSAIAEAGPLRPELLSAVRAYLLRQSGRLAGLAKRSLGARSPMEKSRVFFKALALREE